MKHLRKIGDFKKTEDLRNKIGNLITKSKEKYYPRNKSKLKTFLSILKTTFSGKKSSYIPLFFINNKFVNYFQKRTNVFNYLFTKQRSLITSSSIFSYFLNLFLVFQAISLSFYLCLFYALPFYILCPIT